MGWEAIAFAAPFIWVAAVIFFFALHRRKSGRPIFPRVPDNAIFSEVWTSGRSLKNALTRLGGARNSLLVYVADGMLTIVPAFPFSLMVPSKVYGLEMTVPVTKVGIAQVDGFFGKRLRISIEGSTEQVELALRDPEGFQRALASKSSSVPGSASATESREHRTGWSFVFFRGFAILWGAGVIAAMAGELKTDLQFRKAGVRAVATMVDHTGQAGSGSGNGILQYFVEGHPYRIVSLQGSGVYRIGDTAEIRYMPDDPASGREDSHLIFDLVFAFMGICMLTLGLTLGRIVRFFRRQMNV